MRSLMRRGGRAAVAMTVISLAVTGAALANATTY
jgi:hypothetical protein